MTVKYDFDKIVDRKNTHSAKYDELEMKFGTADVIPMWIADLDFKMAQPVIDALVERAEEGIWGYTSRTDEYFKAVKDWQKYKNQWDVDVENMAHALGILPMLANLMNTFAKPGDKVILQPPVFSEFMTVCKNWDLEIVNNPLIQSGNDYFIDFEDLEEKAKDAKFIIFCNPHNPVGRLWREDEIRRLAEICVKNNVMIISDEMYSDMTLFNNKHVPTAKISKEIAVNTITCTSVGKTFNLAGLQVATVIFPNVEMREKYELTLAKFETKRNNAFSIVANTVSMNEGREWFEQLMTYIEDNMKFAMNYIDENIPGIKYTKPDATYLLWLDCRDLGLPQEELVQFFVKDAKLALNDGVTFGKEGTGYMRMNIGSPRSVIQKALEQLRDAVDNLNK